MAFASISLSSGGRLKTCCWLLTLALIYSICCAVLRFEAPVIVAAASTDGGSHVVSGPRYEMQTDKDHPNMLTVMLNYTPGQNTSLAMESVAACIGRVAVGPVPEGSSTPEPVDIGIPRFCHEGVLDLSTHLKQGLNQIVFSVEHNEESVCFWERRDTACLILAPVLFGTNGFSTAACAIIFLMSLGLGYKLLRWFGLDMRASVIAMAGFAYYALWLHVRPNTLYTADVTDHINYALYMTKHWLQPFEYHGGEDKHPPLYYILSGLFIDWLSVPYAMSQLTTARIFSLLLYMVMVAYGLRTLQESIRPKSALYYIGAVLFVFWPVAVDSATNIDNDLGVWAVWAAAFYYLARWYRERDSASLSIAIMLSGLCLMVKSSTFIFLGIVACTVLCGLFSRRITFRQCFEKRALIAYGVLVLGAVVNLGKLIYERIYHGESIGVGGVSYHFMSGFTDHPLYAFSYYLYFSPWDFIANVYPTFMNEPGFFNYFLKTMLYSQWNHPENFLGLAYVISIQLILFLLIVIMGTLLLFFRHRATSGDMLPMVLNVVICFVGLMIFTMLHGNEFCQSLRFVYPVLVPLVILFVRGLEAAGTHRLWRPFYWLGLCVGICFPLSALVFYLHYQPVL